MLPPSRDSVLPKTELSKEAVSITSFQSSILYHYFAKCMNLSDFDVFCCHDARCANNGHKTQVDALYSELPTCLVSAVSSTMIFYYYSTVLIYTVLIYTLLIYFVNIFSVNWLAIFNRDFSLHQPPI